MNALVQNGQQEQKGFTLIELVIVIIILGILAAIAAPKFIDLTGDAHKATLHGIAGAMRSAAELQYSKSLLAEGGLKEEEFTDSDIHVRWGQINATSKDQPGQAVDGRPEILEAIDLDITNYHLVTLTQNSYTIIIITPRAYVDEANVINTHQNLSQATKIWATGCFIQYRNYWADFGGNKRLDFKVGTFTDGC